MNWKLRMLIICALFSLACSMAGGLPRLLGNSYEGWLCFESGKDIWVVRTDGSQLQNITDTSSVWEGNCKLSWDSHQILYTDTDGNLSLINRNGTGKRQLLGSEDGEAMYPSWSPDGSKILFVRMEVQEGAPVMSLHVLDVASGVEAKIHESATAILSPVMSPDGKKIAFASGSIFTIDADGSNLKEILSIVHDEPAGALAWSKDGSKIAFATTSGVTYGAETWAEYGNIYVIDPDGSGLVNLTNSAPDPSVELEPGKNIFKFDSNPCWTSGDQIIFLSNMDTRTYTLKPYIMKDQGAAVKLLLDQEMNGMDYQPDAAGNATPVPTAFDISTAVSREREFAATAQASSTDCRNGIDLPMEVDWPAAVCDNFSTDRGIWDTGSHDDEYGIFSKSVQDRQFHIEIDSKKPSLEKNWVNVGDSDFFATVTAAVVSDADTSAGIVFRGSDAGYYIFSVSTSHQTYYIGYRQDGTWVDLVNWTSSPIIFQSGGNQLAVQGMGDEYIVYINRREVDRFSDSTLTGNKIGFSSSIYTADEHADFYYDDFLVLTP